MSTTRSQKGGSKESTSFPVGQAAKRELRRALLRSTDPAETIKEFQQSHSLHSMMARAFGTTPRHGADEEEAAKVESLDTDSVMMFLSHLGLSQFDVHKRISDTLLKQLEDEIRKTQSEQALLDLLQNCWAFVTANSELQPVLLSVLKQLGERTPLAVLKALTERDGKGELKHIDIFSKLPPLLQRLCWEADWDGRIPQEPDSSPQKYLESVESTLLYEAVHPLIDEYCSNKVLVDAANRPFVATIRECRLLTTQRRALTSQSTTTAASATPGTSTSAASLLRTAKPAAPNALTSGKSVAQLRSLLSDTVGSASVYRPKLLYTLLSILMAKHGADSREFLGGAEHLHCTLTADILLSAGGSLPKAYQHVLNLASVLDECVQEGVISDQSIVKVQATLALIFQPDMGEGAQGEKDQKDDTNMDETTDQQPSNAMKRQLNRLITAGLAAMKDADPQNLFLNPVTDKIAPGYSKVISKPMCIITMERKVSKNAYNSLTAWESDVKLMFKNCIDYNRGNNGQWFRGEAHRQGKVFREEIFPQAKKLYQKEIAKRNSAKDEQESRKRKAAEEGPTIKPLAPSTKKRKKEKEEYLPSMPALASMLLSDPFVVRILLFRVLRDLRRGVLNNSSLPAKHPVIPSLLQILHIARWSTQICAIRGKRFFVPDSGIDAPKDTKDPAMLVPYISLRQFTPQLVCLMSQEELDRRVAQGGDLYDAAQVSDLKSPAMEQERWKSDEKVQVVVALLQGAMVQLCQPVKGNEASLSVTFPKFSVALQNISSSLSNDLVFFLCLISALLKHKSKLPKATRDVVVTSWLGWLRKGGDKEGAVASAAHEYFIRLLNEWSALGNLLLPRDTLIDFATEAVNAVNSSESSDERKFAKMWAQGGEEFAPIRKQYERMLKHLPPARAKEWRQRVGIEDEDAVDPPETIDNSHDGAEHEIVAKTRD